MNKSYLLFYLIIVNSTISYGQTINELLSVKKNIILEDSLISKKKINSSINTSLLIHDFNKENSKKPIAGKYSLDKIDQDYLVDAFIEINDQINLEDLKSFGVVIFKKE